MVSTCCCIPMGVFASANVTVSGGGSSGLTSDLQSAQFNASGSATVTMNLNRLNFFQVVCLTSGGPTAYPSASGWTISVGATAPTLPNYRGDALSFAAGGLAFQNNNQSFPTPDDGGVGRVQNYIFAPELSTAGSTIDISITVPGAAANHYLWVMAYGGAEVTTSNDAPELNATNSTQGGSQSTYTQTFQYASGVTASANSFYQKTLVLWNTATAATLSSGRTTLNTVTGSTTAFTDDVLVGAQNGNRWIGFGFVQEQFGLFTDPNDVGQHRIVTASANTENFSLFNFFIAK